MFSNRHITCWRFWLPAFLILLAPAAALAADEPFDYFRNSWNVIGLKDYAQGTRVTPDNRLLLAAGREAQIRCGGNLSPLNRQQVKTLLDGWLPVILLTAQNGNVRYDFRLWATPLPTVSDWRKAFDWPVETENYLNWIAGRVTNTGKDAAEAKWDVVVRGVGVEETTATFGFQLQPGQTQEHVVRLPFEAAGTRRRGCRGTGRRERRIVAAAHRSVLARAAGRGSSDRGALSQGDGCLAGRPRLPADRQRSRRVARRRRLLRRVLYPRRRLPTDGTGRSRPVGRGCQGGRSLPPSATAGWPIRDSNQAVRRQRTGVVGAVAVCSDHGRSAVAPAGLSRRCAARPIGSRRLAARRRRIRLSRVCCRLRRPTASSCGTASTTSWVTTSGTCAACSAWRMPRSNSAAPTRRASCATKQPNYRAAIDAACRRSGLSHFPPSWEKAGTHWGNTETLWPTPIFAADDPRVGATIDHARRVHGGGFIEGTIQWLGGSPAIHPYMSAYTTMASLRRGEHEQVVEDFYWYLLHSTAAHAFPEGIFPARRFAWSDTIPHVTGASNYALLLRHMLVDERGDELHLLAAVPDGWLAEGQTIKVHRAADALRRDRLDRLRDRRGRDGPVDAAGPAEAEADRALSSPVSTVDGNAQPAWILSSAATRRNAGTSRPWSNCIGRPPARRPSRFQAWFLCRWPNRSIRLAARSFRWTRWPTPTPSQRRSVCPSRASSCSRGCGPGNRPRRACRSGSSIPLRIKGVASSSCTRLALPRTSLGPRRSRSRWERPAKRLFFLGNVHGWSSQDPGTGPWGAVAEYEVVYADGQRQTVPLITGRTIDEWSARPEADEVQVGPRGEPWHLNVLAVALRDVPVQEVVFRDLGTPAAPVLAAVTLERK